ncbi:hypothetical protein JAAARDRAFT_196112 [Jaapia argillacea MUCL 33604]|uniref:Fungal N-terminal domain-containing protein n=1 Tax=Jaapia argillacea MUCL 33604 TaxID=933084 RepID=A0A067PKB7_9AGAM|nr:hypothetical protein JAAARDRAFT_196112 [Jaapia argillacea MUCL 33604]
MFKSKGKKKGVADAVLDNSGFAVAFIANLADGAIAVPGLKAAAQIAKQLIEVAQKVKSNKEDCETVASRTCELVGTLVKCLEGKREEEIEEGLKGNIDEFGRQLEKIRTEMHKMASRKTLSRIVNHTKDAQDIIQWKECLDQAHKTFQIQLGIGGRLFAADAHQQVMSTQQQVMQKLDAIQQGVVLPPNLK